ncbi:sensor histidine kinase [Mucilaginibacter sp. AK015]|uniref:sensor histidine kinase n=1 Tax=Mucilaginibacter sp. AK015 TaxID=2723072 RepID=UPI00161772ED|nr:ATP-binding protein [Mucilaginibacter sp. AK015]MBB5397381.1 signal transduction histidine kinase [Mucilaginibacter sp. AK015]
MANADIKEIILIATIIFLLAPTFLVLYVNLYNQRKKKHIEEKALLESRFQQELLKTQVEMQEQTLNYISREIHDNVTQVLSFVKLNLAMPAKATHEQVSVKIDESRNLIAQVINDLRDLSKSLSYDHIVQLGLVKTIEIEAGRINKSGIIKIDLAIGGNAQGLGEQRELVLFRIFQEALNNALKHSGAKQLKISLDYFDHLFNLTIQDNGVGFLAAELPNGGSGLKNIVNRAALIGAAAVIDSAPGKGCCIKISIDPLTQHTHANGDYHSAG